MVRYLQTHRVGLAPQQALLDLRLGQVAAFSAVDLGPMLSDGLPAFLFQLLRRAKTAVSFALRQQLRGVRSIEVETLRLAIRTEFALLSEIVLGRTLVPGQAEPDKIVDQLFLIARFRAIEVRVLDAQDELAPRPLGVHPVKQGCSRISDVQQAGRGRRKAHAYRSALHITLDHNLPSQTRLVINKTRAAQSSYSPRFLIRRSAPIPAAPAACRPDRVSAC